MTTTSRPGTGPVAQGIAERIARFLDERTRSTWGRDVDLFVDAGLSSLFAMELVVFLENDFDVEIAGADLRLDNFRTIDRMTELVIRLRDSAGDGG